MRTSRTRWTIPLLALLAAAVLLVQGGTSNAQGSSVDVQDDVFVPDTIEVPEGTTVAWTHSGENPHTVTADDGSFDSHPTCPPVFTDCMEQGDTYEVTFDEPGEFGHHCKVHGSPGAEMAGTVVVVAAETEEIPTEELPEEGPPEQPTEDPPAEDPPAEDAPAAEPPADEAGPAADTTTPLPDTGAGGLVALMAVGLGLVWLAAALGLGRAGRRWG